MRNTEAALKWIVGILQKLNIPFEIDGGLAAEAYGANRELADIDINVPETEFEKIIPHVKEYLTHGPAWYKDEHWELYMMTAKYFGQNIDIGALGKTKYYDKKSGAWRELPSDLGDVRIMEYMGIKLPFINEMKLLIYKDQLGRGVDRKDVRGMENQLERGWGINK